MKLGLFTDLFDQKSLIETLDIVQSKGLEAIELGTGGDVG
jgi:sugar phosphate isomerase/epimerase